ncbi:2-hydroxyacid dehydrogenase [Salinicola rhizosphaerae]|uniref:Glyoxylate/hydroxypyruvate reductase A n=1 Tax=Salinicola rhizosphaerae TaxID=1443141 RepID=A0ABQ3DZA9_9GAMM|nr:glyoxylate/hydroxypyruvate reductase A [Salinicola rhizosphaerae]GHB18439.1 glyoxylate/hydroxypyruvate reductase A [Salinicola rhizosphaerae]
MAKPLHGVVLGTPSIMAPYLAAFEAAAPNLVLMPPEAVDDPAAIAFALAWDPDDDAFRPYPNLRLVSSIAAGVNGILASASLPGDVPLMRIAGEMQAKMMAGFVTWHVLWHHRRFGDYLANQRLSRWEHLLDRDASEIRVGLMGAGKMGGAVAESLLALGYDVAIYSRSGRNVPAGVTGFSGGREALERLAARSEILINLLPLTAQTRGILDADLFACLPRGGALIHVGRGEHLLEADLLAALDSGQLAGASLDVFAVEPLPRGHPFWRHERIVVTPHDACDSTPAQVAQEVAAALEGLDAGRLPTSLVDREAGY